MDQEKSRLGTEKLGTLMPKLALPTILANFINILYNVVDRIYIGHLDSNAALTGVGICLPILQLVTAFSFFSGNGGAPLAAIELGKSELDANAKKNAERILGNSIFLLIAFSVILTTVFLVFKEPVLMAFGASSQTLPFASDYITIYLAGTFFVQISLGLNPFIACQGHSKTAMVGVLIGAVINLVLDPLFIFTFGMGVKGAAIATVISQFFSAVWVLRFLCSKKSTLRIRPSILKLNFKFIRKISALGISPFTIQATESAIFIVFNSGLQKYGGDLYVGTMTIMQSIYQILFVPLSGLNSGVQPIISYNYGAQKIERVRGCVKRMTIVSGICMLILNLTATLLPKQLASFFTKDVELIELVGKFLPVYIAGLWTFWIQNVAQMTFIGLGKSKVSVFIAFLRKIFLLIPLALVLPKFFGAPGIYYAEPIATTISAITSAIVLFNMVRKL